MRYLKRYNESKVKDQYSKFINLEIIDNCKDILIDLKDDNFFTLLSEREDLPYLSIGFTIAKQIKYSLNDINEYIDRLKSYLEKEGFTYKQVMSNVDHYHIPININGHYCEDGAFYYSFIFENKDIERTITGDQFNESVQF